MSDLPFNLPARLDPESLDYTERLVASGILVAAPDLTAPAITALRGTDFESVALETIVRAVDRTIRADRPKTVENVASIAVEQGLVRREHEVDFERLVHDVLDGAMGEIGIWYSPALIFRGAIRSVTEIAERAEQIVDLYRPGGEWAHAEGPGAVADAIAAAPDLAHALEGLAEQLQDVARRLRADVGPRDQFTARRLSGRPIVRLVHKQKEVAA